MLAALAIGLRVGRSPTTLQPNSGIATVGDAYLTFTAPVATAFA